jgi:hypothetical protein
MHASMLCTYIIYKYLVASLCPVIIVCNWITSLCVERPRLQAVAAGVGQVACLLSTAALLSKWPLLNDHFRGYPDAFTR